MVCVSTIAAEMGVTGPNVALELGEGGIGVCGVCQAIDILPGISFHTGVTSGPLDCFTIAEVGSPSKFLNIVEEFVESGRVRGKSGSLAAVSYGHKFSGSHGRSRDDSEGRGCDWGRRR